MSRIALPLGQKQPGKQSLVDSCEVTTGWSQSNIGNGGTWTVETGGGPQGQDCFNVSVADDAAQVRLTKTISLFNSGLIGIWLKWPGFPSGGGNVTIYFTEDGFTNFFAYTVRFEEGAGTEYHQSDGDWVFFTIPSYSFAKQGAGNSDWVNEQTQIRVICTCQTGDTNGVTQVGPIYGDLRGRSKVAITFDDSNDTDFTGALPTLNTYGMRATSYNAESLIGTTNHLTLAQIQGLHAAGWDIGIHGELNWKTSTYAQVEAKCLLWSRC